MTSGGTGKRKSANGRRATRLLALFERLHDHHGPQHWWPGDGPFEVMVGAILTQNTAWSNVERAIDALDRAGALEARAITTLPHRRLASLIRPAGYFNVKARRLRNFCQWYLQQGEFKALAVKDTDMLREGLLSVNGVGPETADDILLYAFERPVFVIDAYTRRLLSRIGHVDAGAGYEELRLWCERTIGKELGRSRPGSAAPAAGYSVTGIYNEFHALIVVHGKSICRPRPLCEQCVLARGCGFRSAGG